MLGQANAMYQQQGRLGLVSTATLLKAQALLMSNAQAYVCVKHGHS